MSIGADTEVLDRPQLEERPWAEWSGSVDALVWSPWKFMCWLDEDMPQLLRAPHVHDYDYIKVRILRPPAPPEHSQIFTWEHDDDDART